MARRRPAGASRRLPRLDRRGIASLEFVIVAAIFFLTMIAVMDLSRYYLTMHSMRTVVAQAARALMINPLLATGTCNSAPLVAAAGGLGFVAGTGQLCATATAPQAGMIEIYLTLDAPFGFILPIFGVRNTTIVERQRFRFAS